jgi:hypothetical protein
MSGKNLFYIALVSAVFFLSPQSSDAAIPGNRVAATRYDVTVHKVELCTTNACAEAVQVGAGIKTFNIASQNAGADVGSYANAAGLPAGQTFTHVRLTIGMTFTIAGGGLDNGGQNCQTVNGNAAGDHTTVGTGTVGGAGTPMPLTVPNVGTNGIVQADYDVFNLTKQNGAATGTITFPLAAPFKIGANEPLIKVSFDTSSALGVVQTGAGTCAVFPQPPSVNISISAP